MTPEDTEIERRTRLQADKELVRYAEKDLSDLKEMLLNKISHESLSMLTGLPESALSRMTMEEKWSCLTALRQSSLKKAKQSSAMRETAATMVKLSQPVANMEPGKEQQTPQPVAAFQAAVQVPGHNQAEVEARVAALERKAERLRVQIGMLDATSRRTAKEADERAKTAIKPLMIAAEQVQVRLDQLRSGTWA